MDFVKSFFVELDKCNIYEHSEKEKIHFLSWLTSDNFWVQLASVFIWAVILAPISKGIIYIILFIILFEIVISIIYKLRVCLFTRLGLACAAIAGFILGRVIYDPTDDPFGQLETFDLKEEINSWIKN